VLLIVRGDKAAGGDGEERHCGRVLGLGSAEDHALHMVVPVVNGVGRGGPEIDAVGECGGDIEPGNVFPQVFRVGIGQVLADADLLRQRAEAAEARRDAHDEKRPRAKGRDAGTDVAVQAVDDGGDGDHAGHADHDAEDGEGGADLARAKGIESDEQVFAKLESGH
jgi:hypothetical protein